MPSSARVKDGFVHKPKYLMVTVSESALRRYLEEKTAYDEAPVEVRNPDMVEDISHTFYRTKEDPDNNKDIIREECAPVTVNFKSFVNNHRAGIKKHYWIYSNCSAFGKTHFLLEMVREYNATIMCDRNNAIGVSAQTQLMLYDGTHAVPDFDTFNALTSGVASTQLKMKRRGKSFRPRKDIQVIVVANESPYQFFGHKQRKTGIPMTSKQDRGKIESRLIVVKLDGDVEEDILKYTHPTSWTHLQYTTHLQDKFYHGCEIMNEEGVLTNGTVNRWLYKCCQLHKSRHTPHGTNFSSFMTDMEEGMNKQDWLTISNATEGMWHESHLQRRHTKRDKLNVTLVGYKDRARQKEERERKREG